MTQDPFEKIAYQALVKTHITSTIQYLFETNQDFALACELENVTFTPSLPDEVQESFPKPTFFVITQYAYESAILEENDFSFESGFGTQNIGARVSIPLLAIQQIFLNHIPLIVNHVRDIDTIVKEEEIEEKITSSMKGFLSNPENQKFLKKKK